VLDGIEAGSVLYIRNYCERACGDIIVEGFTIQSGISENGGGADLISDSCLGPSGNVTMRNNVISGNSAINSGGGVSAGSIISCNPSYDQSGDVFILQNTIIGNTADWGAGVSAVSNSDNRSGNVVIKHNVITGNIARRYPGGGVFAESYSKST
jgi:hypothetical protein